MELKKAFSKKNLKSKLIITVAITAYTVIAYLAKFPCIILKITGVHCPGCGMTRAILSALRFDFLSAFKYHAMFWSLPLLYFCFIVDGKLFKNRIANAFFYGMIVAGFFINWLMNFFV